MRHNKFICAVTTLAMTLGVCQAVMPSPASTVSAAGAATVVRLDPSEASPFNDGKFEGWGTSMGWWGNRIGYNDTMAQQAAEDLYSEDGLGLDIVRYNVGGGDNPTHNHINRSDSKLPCFAVPQYEGDSYEASGDNSKVTNLKTDENGDVIYDWDWNADKNQVNVLKKIKEQNSEVHIEGYTNSPPWFMTETQCSSGGEVLETSSDGSKVTKAAENLSPDNYDVFAKFLAEVTKHMDEEDLHFDSYSPMNEPSTQTAYWFEKSGKQEGNLVAPGEHQSGLIKAVKDAFTAAGITNTLIAGPDETDLGYTISSVNALTADAKTALDRIDTHTYGGSNRAGVKQTAIDAGKNLWMSEVDGGWNGFGLADRIIADLNGMQASAWVMWDIIDSHKDSTKFEYPAGSGTHPEANTSLNVTGSLWGVGMGNHDTEEIEWANKYYAYGQFTKYINPGDTLIASSNSTLAAYNKETGDIKVVVNNSGSSDIPYEIDLSAFKTVGNTVKEIRSNNLTGASAEHWKEITDEASLDGKKLTTTAKAGTITTYVISGAEGFDDKYAIIKGGGSEINVNASVQLTLDTNIDGDAAWSVSDVTLADITSDGKTAVVKAKAAGSITVYAEVGGYKVEKSFLIPSYKLSGTPSWGSDSSAPKDSDDYRKAADGDPATYFDGTKNGYVMYDYGSPYKISAVKMAARSGNGMPERTVGGTVQASFDAINWIDLYTIKTAIPAGEYTTVTADKFTNANAYRYYRYTNPTDMTNIAEFLIEGEYSSEGFAQVIDKYSVSDSKLSYSYTLPENLRENDAYFASYDKNGRLTYVSKNAPSGEADGDFTDNTCKLLVWEKDSVKPMDMFEHIDTAEVKDIAEFTDDFEDSTGNIFGGTAGALSDGKVIYASGLERFGNVFVPVKTTAKSELDEAITLGKNQLFRLTFNMFAGWEGSGMDNTFAIKDAEGNEIVALYLTGGGYNVNQIRIGGQNVLASPTVAQSRSKAGSGSKTGANGWDSTDQPYSNTMGYNKTCEILIDGAGSVSVSFTGGMADTTATGTLTSPISIKSIEATGDYAVSAGRVASYDNFDGDVITYGTDFAEPDTPPAPPEQPEIPEDGTLISLDFDNGDLTSGSPYGKAEAAGTAKFATVDDKKVLQLDNTSGTVINLTDANGNGLLAGQEEITISFKVKPTTDATSWWFYSAPNDNAQTYQQEHYLGAMSNTALHIERYNNSGSRSTANDGAITVNDWNDVIISFAENKTDLYINGALASSVASSAKLTDILGTNPVAYIGRANWNTGEFATGYIDDFKIVTGALKSALDGIDLGDLSAVKNNLTLTTDNGITWESSDPDVISTEGVVTRPIDTTDVTLTAKVTENGIPFTRSFTATVIGLAASAETFTAYAEGTTIKYTSEYGEDDTFDLEVTLTGEDGAQIGESKTTATGEFTDLTKDKTYKVNYILKDKTSNEEKKKVTKTVAVKDEPEMAAYLFAHFVGTQEDATKEQMYFSVSQDGTTWKTLNGGKPVLTSNVGTKGVRDPYILRGEDGNFYIIATDLSIFYNGNNWTNAAQKGSKNIVVWKSDDLVNWSNASLVEVGSSNAGCVWAPEAVYDREEGKYMVFWASVISDDNFAKYRIFRSYTSDFENFSDPETYIEEPNAVIDTTIVEEKGVYYRFTKNEAKSSITMQKCTSLNGNWKDVETYTINNVAGDTVTGYEGPTIYKDNGSDSWTLLLDYFSKSQGYKPFVTNDLSKGAFTSGSDFTFDATYRHGTVMPITQAEYNALIAGYPNS